MTSHITNSDDTTHHCSPQATQKVIGLMGSSVGPQQFISIHTHTVDTCTHTYTHTFLLSYWYKISYIYQDMEETQVQ